MTVSSGTRLGPYEILGPIGAGGMGEVYKATDTRLNRTVAIKVLPSHFAHDTDMKQRFEREAQTIAGLNHPNICILHDVGEQDGTHFLVMEYVEGETLADRISRGPMPIGEVLHIAGEIVDALEKAHRDGPARRLVGLVVEGRGIARHGYPVHVGDRRSGVVTSGTQSPTLGTPIAMAYVAPGDGEPGTVVEIDVRATRVPARVVELLGLPSQASYAFVTGGQMANTTALAVGGAPGEAYEVSPWEWVAEAMMGAGTALAR